MNVEKALEYKLAHEQKPKVFEQDHFELAICEVILNNYPKAKSLFEEAVMRMFAENPYWRASAQPNWLVEITILSGRTDLFPSVANELALYRESSTKSSPVGESPLAYYCYSIMGILYPQSGKVAEWISTLTKRTKYKDLNAAGLTLQALLDHDQIAFDNSLLSVLISHEGKAKFGSLKWSPMGWLCLPAMTLAFMGIQENLAVNLNEKYFSKGYLTFLIDQQVPL